MAVTDYSLPRLWKHSIAKASIRNYSQWLWTQCFEVSLKGWTNQNWTLFLNTKVRKGQYVHSPQKRDQIKKLVLNLKKVVNSTNIL